MVLVSPRVGSDVLAALSCVPRSAAALKELGAVEASQYLVALAADVEWPVRLAGGGSANLPTRHEQQPIAEKALAVTNGWQRLFELS